MKLPKHGIVSVRRFDGVEIYTHRSGRKYRRQRPREQRVDLTIPSTTKGIPATKLVRLSRAEQAWVEEKIDASR